MCDILPKKAKYSFVEFWISDDVFKHWILKVSSNEEVYHYAVCDKQKTCGTHPSKHAQSAKHRQNINNEQLNVKNHNSNDSGSTSGNMLFKKSWMEFPSFRPWLREVPHDPHSFFCFMCDKSMTAHLSHLYRHEESKSHRDAAAAYAMETTAEDVQDSTMDQLSTFEDRKKEAEIKYAAFITEKNIPFQLAADILNFFQETGKDQGILQNETCDITNEKWMTFFIRYINPDSLNVNSQLVKLINIDAKDSSAEKLFKAFRDEMYNLKVPFFNILALSCDNAS
ncbi:hypothetical protein PV325_000373, partial [Microctonus aethiopoides]